MIVVGFGFSLKTFLKSNFFEIFISVFFAVIGGPACVGGRRGSLGKYKSEARVAGGDPKTTWREGGAA